MSKVKDKTNILVLMQSLSRQMFTLQVFNNGDSRGLQKRIKLVKQAFRKDQMMKIQLRLRNLIQSTSIKDPDKRQKFINSLIKVSKKIDNSRIKKKLSQSFGVKQDYWIKPNSIQQSVGNLLNNSRYYGMRFYKPEEQSVRYILKQWVAKDKKNIVQTGQSVQKLCQDFNSKYRQLPERNKTLIRQFFMGNVIQQKKVLDQVNNLKRSLSEERAKKLQYIVQNVSSIDKFDKVFLLTSVLQETKQCLNG